MVVSSFTRNSLIAAVIFLLYGYLCRLIPVYFFWESRAIGWILLFVCLLSCLFGVLRYRRINGGKTIWVKIGIGIITFGLVLFPIVIMIFLNTAVYNIAKQEIQNNQYVINEVGTINGFGWIPTGSIQMQTLNGMGSGSAFFNMTVKGEKKYMDIKISMEKSPGGEWIVTSVE